MNQKHKALIIFGTAILYTIGVLAWETYREDPHRFTKFFSIVSTP